MNKDYQKFFELREQFPKKSKLISEIMAAYFQNADSFPKTIYLSGSFNSEDISTILKEFNLENISISTTFLRGCTVTLIFT